MFLKRLYKIIVLMMAVVMLVSCKNETPNPVNGKTDSGKQTVSDGNTTSDDINSDNEDTPKTSSDNISKNSKSSNTGKNSAKKTSWNGVSGYVIVIPASASTNVKNNASRLQEYFLDTFDVETNIVTDRNVEQKKEILIGNTNRKESKLKLSANEYICTYKNEKLIICGGHDISLNVAIKKFIMLNNTDSNVYCFSGEFTDYDLIRPGGYRFCWGDEFNDGKLDTAVWEFSNDMAAPDDQKFLTDERVLNFSDGHMNMKAIRYEDTENSDIAYATTPSLNTKKSMNFKYGFLEFRAKLPFMQGAWPSFWLKSDGKLSPNTNINYYTEIDIFEVFSSTDSLVPNLHKWYFNREHTQLSATVSNKTYRFSDSQNLCQEYHIYGFEWSPEKMSFYVDGKAYYTYDLSKSLDDDDDMSGFQESLYLIISNSIFSPLRTWFPSQKAIINPGTVFPMEYSIDYVRLYQKPDYGELYIG